MKKVLVVALSALLLLAMFIPAMANENPKVITAVSATEVKAGETITVTVSLDKTVNTRGISLDFKDDCDADAFELTAAAFNAEFAGKCLMATPDLAKMKAASAAMAAFDWTGEIFTLTLKVKADAKFGEYPIEVTASVQDASKNEIEVQHVGATVKVTHDCVLATEYTSDADNHWKACTVPGCTEAPAKEAHKYDNACDTTCNVCNYERTITHDFSVQDKDATNHWMKCSVCGTIDEASKAAHVEAAPVLVTPANCKDPAVYKKVCSVCNAQIGETYTEGTPDASQHVVGVKATCKDKAICSFCNQPFGETDPLNHTGATKETKPAKASTCTEYGYSAEISCADCDAVLTPSVPYENLEPHSISVWTEVKAATTEEGGEKKGKCDVCEAEFTVETEKLAASVKAENVYGVEGSKAEAVGETKLPENTEIYVYVASDGELKEIEEKIKEEIAKNPDVAGKKVLAFANAEFGFDCFYTDASGQNIYDNSVITKLPGKVKVTIPFTADLSNYENLVVISSDENGNDIVVAATIENGTIVFETENVFNPVLLFGTEKKAVETTAPATTADPNVPKNGDASNVVFFTVLAFVSVLTLGAVVITKRAKASK